MTSRPATVELDGSNADVLVVDDDPVLRETVLERLQQEGFVAIAATNGAEALRLVRDRKPRLILLDLDMPVVNGWQFLERRRSDPALARIPVIVLSALADLVSGRSDVASLLDKPVDDRELVRAIQSLLASGPVSRPKILLVEDDEDTRTSVAELLEDEGFQVTRACNGQEAENHLRLGDRPDCIVLDLWMPVMDGWRFTNRLEQIGAPPIPILVITAAEPHWGYPVPTSRVVRKPIRPDAFVAMLRSLIPSHEAERSALSAGSRAPSRSGRLG